MTLPAEAQLAFAFFRLEDMGWGMIKRKGLFRKSTGRSRMVNGCEESKEGVGKGGCEWNQEGECCLNTQQLIAGLIWTSAGPGLSFSVVQLTNSGDVESPRAGFVTRPVHVTRHPFRISWEVRSYTVRSVTKLHYIACQFLQISTV